VEAAMELADLDLSLIFKRIEVERRRDADIRETIAIVRDMIESQRQAQDADPLDGIAQPTKGSNANHN
jgi:hypothetical protein